MEFHFRRATSVYRKTMPFVLLRIGIGLLIGLCAALYFGILFWVGTRLLDTGTISGWIAGLGIGLALLLFAGGWRLVSKYVLYLVTAGHIAVIAHIVETGEVPDDQLQFGKGRVQERFAEASALFAIDKLVKAAIKQFNDGVVSLSGFFTAVPSLEQLVRLVGKAIALAASYVDEAIIAYMFVDDEENPWRSARDGVVLYGKSWKPVLASTMLIVIGAYVAAGAVLLALSPVAAVLSGVSPVFEALGWAVVGGLGLAVYAGLLKPWVKTVVITTFLLESRTQTPDSETADWIAQRSETFRDLTAKADDEATSTGRQTEDQAVPEASA